MADTGWLTPGTVVNEVISGSYGNWSSPGNAVSSNNQYAQATVGSGSPITAGHNSNWLKGTGYGAAVPGDHTITLLEVEVEGSVSGGGPYTEDMVLVIGGTTGNTSPDSLNATGWTTSDSAKVSTYSEAQCAALTPAIVNASGFGVAVRMRGSNSGPPFSRAVYVDVVRVRITYEPPPVQPHSTQHGRRRRT